jgi:hypothetical protein
MSDYKDLVDAFKKNGGEIKKGLNSDGAEIRIDRCEYERGVYRMTALLVKKLNANNNFAPTAYALAA